MKELKKLKLLVSNEESKGRCDGAVRGNPMTIGVSAVFCSVSPVGGYVG